ncbi:glycosyl transferase family 1 [Thiocapsa imhoffii]|uniref:Glycosyl transferase family 1 n=1 Tax=Thiocapsa imhoffii TaxID=382777 RepID=A0A9X0WHK6_9GAMM|nr:glycosyltransferase family 4 protein [Thiocapsa imhoffii]MBK1644849.1 glycosyl transferase family 1 [Thiocapsa imhoffii]
MLPSICFVGGDNYPIINPEYGDRYFGGESVQQTLIAKAFQKLGYPVHMVVLDYGQPDGELIDGIHVWRTYREGAGFPVIRFVHPKTTKMLSALNRANCDIYFQSCSGAVTGLVGWYCSSHRRSFIYRVASDADCVNSLPLIRYGRDRWLYKYGLKQARIIAAQSEHQRYLLSESFNQDSTLIDMAVDIPSIPMDRKYDFDVIWVNNFRSLKRPNHVLTLAKALPQYRFLMIGGPVPGSEGLYEKIVQEAGSIKNLNVIGPVPYSRVGDYFLKSRLFINTSEIEGFPNSMLQAWAAAVPVLSYLDPDGVNVRCRLGDCPNDIKEMEYKIQLYLEHAELLAETGERARAHVLRRHAPNAIAEQYIEAMGIKKL